MKRIETLLQKTVQNAGGEDPAHSAAFDDQGGISKLLRQYFFF